MKNRTKLLVLFALSVTTSFAQSSVIECSTERNHDNSISIIASSTAFGQYTIKLTFTSFSGFTGNSQIFNNVFLGSIEGGRKEILKLSPQSSTASTSLQYRYRYFPGRSLQKAPDSSFAYLLPATPGNHLRISSVKSLSEWVGPKSSDNYYATGFVYKLGDTICASRAGFVTVCIGNEKEGEAASVTYRRSRNKFVVQHKDGSIAEYSILAPIKLLTTEGSYIFPGEPLAVFNEESAKYHLFFSVYYLDQKRVLSDNDAYVSSTSPSCYLSTPAHFYSNENEPSISLSINKEYLVLHPRELIALEMTKRDKKKMGFQ